MLDINNLVVSYGGVPALFGVTLNVNVGEIVSVVGSNGCGKSTLLRAVSGLLKPESGEIRLNGKMIQGKSAHEIVKQGIVMVPEGRHLFGRMSIYQNLMMGAYLVANKNVITARLEKAYAIFPKLKARETQLAGTLSGGEQQMVAIARGLMASPELLLLDEPSLGLSPKLVKEMFHMIKDIKENGMTIMLVEQRLHEALLLSDRAYVMQTGKIILQGQARELLESPEVRQAYLGL